MFRKLFRFPFRPLFKAEKFFVKIHLQGLEKAALNECRDFVARSFVRNGRRTRTKTRMTRTKKRTREIAITRQQQDYNTSFFFLSRTCSTASEQMTSPLSESVRPVSIKTLKRVIPI